MQKVMLIGNLGRDPEVKYGQQGTAIAQFSVATSERWKDRDGELQEHTEWFAVKAFGRRAEIVGEHLCTRGSRTLRIPFPIRHLSLAGLTRNSFCKARNDHPSVTLALIPSVRSRRRTAFSERRRR